MEMLFTYTTIPSGWKACAYIYNTVGTAATSYIRSLGVPCSQYINDRHLGQLRPHSNSHVNFLNFQLAEMGTFIAFSVLLELGHFLSIVKSVFIPRIKVKFLGHICQSDIQAFMLPRDKVLMFGTLRDSILESKTVSLKKLQKFAGKTTSFSLSIPAAKLLPIVCIRPYRQPRCFFDFEARTCIGVFLIGMGTSLGKMKSTSRSLFSVIRPMLAGAGCSKSQRRKRKHCVDIGLTTPYSSQGGACSTSHLGKCWGNYR